MRYIFKILFATIIVILSLSTSFGQKIIVLKIVGGDLQLSGDVIANETTEVGNFFRRKVIWQAMDDNIKSYQILAKDPTQKPIFGRCPCRKHDRNLKLRVRLFKHRGDWLYSIYWTDASGGVHIHDPKISIKPK